MWDVWNVGCLRCGMFGVWDVRDVGCSGCGMLGMWDIGGVGYSVCGIWNVGSLPGCGILIHKSSYFVKVQCFLLRVASHNWYDIIIVI